MIGRSKCEMLKNLSFGVTQESRSSQTSWLWIAYGVRVRGRLIEPGENDLARSARKGPGRLSGIENRQRGERRTPLNDDVSTVKIGHDYITSAS